MRHLFVLFGLLSALVPTIAGAVTFNVNTTLDQVDAVPGNGICRTAAGTCSLRAAITEANNTAALDIIVLPNGIFPISINGAAEDLNATGDFDILNPLQIRGAGLGVTIIDGKSKDRIFDALVGKNLALRDLTVRNGLLSGGDSGAGLRYTGAGTTLTLLNVEFSNNTANLAGGCLVTGNTDVSVVDSIFENNYGASSGSALLVAGSTLPVMVTGSLFSGNRTVAGGPAVLLSGVGDATIDSSEFFNNESGGGGSPGGLHVITNNPIIASNLTFDESLGGAFYFSSANSNVTLNSIEVDRTNCGVAFPVPAFVQTNKNATIDAVNVSNSSCSLVSGLYVQASENISLRNSTISNNLVNGPGQSTVYLQGVLGIAIDGLRVVDNRAKGISAGLVANTGGANIISNSTISDNTGAGAQIGGAYLSGTSVLLRDSLIQNNSNFGIVGGLYVSAANTLTLDRVSLLNNVCNGSSCSAGNAYIAAGAGGVVRNSTVSGGSSDNIGGGITASGAIRLVNSTVTDNFAAINGAGVLNAGGAIFANTIISNNLGATNCFGAVGVSENNNLFGDGSCAVAMPNDLINPNPKLLALANQGGGILASAPNVGSPVIDKAKASNCPPIDQRKLARPFDGDQNGIAVCDIGAIEFNDFCPFDAAKTFPGTCGCGVADADLNTNGVTDCLNGQELSFNLTVLRSKVAALKKVGDDATKKQLKKNNRRKKAVTQTLGEAVDYANANAAGISLAGGAALNNELEALSKAVRKARKTKNAKFNKNKKNALKQIDKLISLL